MEILVEAFSIFGGLDTPLDLTRPLPKLIEEHILQNYDKLKQNINKITLNEKQNIKLLRAIATGNRKIFSSFNRAGLNNQNGGQALNFLQQMGIIEIEYSREIHPKQLYKNQKVKKVYSRYRISHKVIFNTPFLRFWFYFILPYEKEIKEQNYTNFFKFFEQRKYTFVSFMFEELSQLMLHTKVKEKILSSGSYWDAKVEIDILTQTLNNEIYVAECKWKNHKINKKELNKLLEKCEKISLKPHKVALFSKRGFSKELLQLNSDKVLLFSCEDFFSLV